MSVTETIRGHTAAEAAEIDDPLLHDPAAQDPTLSPVHDGDAHLHTPVPKVLHRAPTPPPAQARPQQVGGGSARGQAGEDRPRR